MTYAINTARTTTGIMHNGPICQTCGARYIGSHSCTPTDILRRVNELLGLIRLLPPQRTADLMAGCPCRPENGGSGICGCVLSGPKVTC